MVSGSDWNGTKWEGKVLGECMNDVEMVYMAPDSGLITVIDNHWEVYHWESVSERWVEGRSVHVDYAPWIGFGYLME